MSEFTSRIPIDKAKVMKMFNDLPKETQAGIAGALGALAAIGEAKAKEAQANDGGTSAANAPAG